MFCWKLGFQNVISADGNVENLKELILQNFDKKDGSLIYISGETIDYILEDKNYTVDNFYDTNTELFSKMIKQTYENFRKMFDNRDKELWKQIKRDVDLLLWNNM